MPHSTPDGLKQVQNFEQKLNRQNDAAAQINRQFFLAHRVLALHLVSSPGAGKTELLLATAQELKKRYFLTLVDTYGANGIDAQRFQDAGLPALGPSPKAEGRIDARLLGEAVLTRPLKDSSLVFIEGSGGLPYPFDLDLGERAKVMLFSPDQGHDKPFKLAPRLKGADLVLLSKCDLIETLDFDLKAFKHALKAVHPRAELLEVSAKTGQGLAAWTEWIAEQANKLEP